MTENTQLLCVRLTSGSNSCFELTKHQKGIKFSGR